METVPHYCPLAGRHLEQVGERLQNKPPAWSAGSSSS
ncbi:hypothetical protein DFAR_1830020 [Desulfarculales bacterium]